MTLEEYVQLPGINKAALARSIGVSQPMVHQWIKKIKPISPESAIKIERATNGIVKRAELRPDIFGPLAL